MVAMGSVCGTIKAAVDKRLADGRKDLAMLKIKLFRPLPYKAIAEALSGSKNIAVLEKAVSLGAQDGALALELSRACKKDARVRGFVVGLGGRDITVAMISKIAEEAGLAHEGPEFVGKA
jgi:pyruvate ferredoxin oxidoreductase alpha subunit